MTHNVLSKENFKINHHGEAYLYSLNRHTFEKQSSEQIYQRYFKDKFSQKETLYIIFGTDSGLLIQYLAKKERAHNSRYLFIELPEVIEKIKGNLPDIDDGAIVLSTPENWRADADKLDFDIYIYKDQISYTKSLATVDCFYAPYSVANVEIVKQLESTFFFTRALVGVFPFMSRQLMNISENKIPSTVMDNVLKGKTAVILGGGPSLDNDINWVKDNQKNLVIFAVSRIARNLLKHDITPHFIVSVDPYDVSFDVSKELLLLPPETIYLQANCASPKLVSQWHGRTIYLNARYPWQDKDDEHFNKMAGPTVTNTALKAALEMGCENILLTGVDLCYSASGVSHASGSNEALCGPILSQPGTWVETYAGNMAETQIAFENAIQGLSTQAKEFHEKGVNIYNLSINAAKAELIDYVPTSALSFENEKDNIWQLINDNIPTLNQEQIRQDNNNTLKKVKDILKDVKTIKSLAEQALEANEQLFSEKGKESENFKHKLKMDKIEKQLNSRYKKASRFVKNFGLDQFVKSTQASHDEWEDEKVQEVGKLYYQAYIASSINLIKVLNATIARIESRIEEEKAQPNTLKLIEQWQAEQQYGRAGLWREKHPEISLNEEEQEKFDALAQLFEQQLTLKETSHLKRTQKEASLTGVKRKINVLYHQNNVDALNVIKNSLEQYQGDESKEYVQQLYTLANGYLASLQQNSAAVISCFEGLSDEFLTEDELQQIAKHAILVKQFDKAEAALNLLAEINSFYYPNYAKILKLLGKYQDAINTYSAYLSESPQDNETWLALAQLYADINATESALMAVDIVLKQAPDNSEALTLKTTLSH